MNELIETLRQSLSARWRPEQVAALLIKSRPQAYTKDQLALMEKAVPRWMSRYTSSMPIAFDGAKGMAKQCKTAGSIFKVKPPADSPKSVRRFIDRLRWKMEIKKGVDFKDDRLNRKQRKRKKLPRGHRAYNKRFRLIAHLERKFLVWERTRIMRDLARVAKSRLAFKIEKLTDIEAAAFLAWITARLNVRSTFTFGTQERAFDEIAAMLSDRIPAKSKDWYHVALVYPAPFVLAHLNDRLRGKLLGEWSATMRVAADVLKRVAEHDKPNLEAMVVRRGNDSSTWNEAAGAFNKARDGWINTLHALCMDDVLDICAPGKAMRLMAADVAHGHRIFGEGLDPDTKVWNALPKPWDVMDGTKRCNRAVIEKACEASGTKHGGWIKPRVVAAVPFKPTPELVHGVVCSDPALAKMLKAAGYFGGHGHKVKGYVKGLARPFDGKTVSAGPITSSAEDYDA